MIQLKRARREDGSVPKSSDMEGDFSRHQIAREAKAIVALAFRNGPIEQVHAGKPCPTCAGHPGISRITDDEMKAIMQNAVDHVYALLALKTDDPAEYERQIRFGERYAANWDDPKCRRTAVLERSRVRKQAEQIPARSSAGRETMSV